MKTALALLWCFVLWGEGTFAWGATTLNWVQTTLDRVQLRVGEAVRVGCRVLDELDRPLPGADVVVQVRVGGKWQRRKARWIAPAPGSWEFRCVARWQGQQMHDRTPVSVLVTPALPARLVLTKEPKGWVRPGQEVMVKGRVEDRFGNEVIHVKLKYTVKPSRDTSVKHAPALRFLKEGRYLVKVRVLGQTEQQREISSAVHIKVDGKGPRIRLYSPMRASILRGEPKVRVHGRVEDRISGVKQLKLNGKRLQLSEDGEFSRWLPCRWGLNLLTLEAEDQAGRRRRLHQSFLYSPRYRAYSPKERSGLLPRAVGLRIAHSFLDDGSRHSLNDVASLLEYILNQVKVDALVPKMLVKGSYRLPPFGPTWKFQVEKRGPFRIGKRTIKLKLFRGKIWLGVGLKGFQIPLRLRFGSMRIDPLLYAKRLKLSLWLHLDLHKGKPKLKLARVFSDFSNVQVRGLTGVFRWLQGLIEGQLRSRVRGALIMVLRRQLLPVLQKFLQGYKLDQTWKLPPEMGAQALRLTSKLQNIQISKKAITLIFAGGVAFLSKQAPKRTWGAILAPKQPLRWPKASLALMLSVDFLNQFLYTLWASGALKRDLTPMVKKSIPPVPSQLPLKLPIPRLEIDAQLPPVLMPGNKRYPIAFGLGDLAVSLEIPDEQGRRVAVKAHISVVLGFNVSQKDGEIRFVVAPKPLQLRINITRLQGISEVRPTHLAAFLEEVSNRTLPLLFSSILPRLPMPRFSIPQSLPNNLLTATKKPKAKTTKPKANKILKVASKPPKAGKKAPQAKAPTPKGPKTKPKVASKPPQAGKKPKVPGPALTPKAAAELKKVSEKTLRALSKLRILPKQFSYKGAHFLFSLDIE